MEEGKIAANAGLAGLLEAHRRELLRFLTARSGDAHEAEDLLQELWLKAAHTPAGPVANGRAYLFRMANNLVLDRSRERQRAMRRDRDWLERDEIAPATIETRADPSPGAEDGLIEAEEVEALHQAIASLPDGARRAVLLYRFEGLGQAEIAAVMGISRSGVEKHLALAMRHLRLKLADCGFFAPAPSQKREPAGGQAPHGKTTP
jgi:RNA polymerase sigma-70 factor (ECF subfamily)